MDINVTHPISKALAAETYAEAADILMAGLPDTMPMIDKIGVVERVLSLKMHIGSGEEAFMNKSNLDSTCTKRAQDSIDDLNVYGNPDQWKLLSKASSESRGFMRSTKAMEVPGGTLVQVSTLENGIPAEALAFVPGAIVPKNKEGQYVLE